MQATLTGGDSEAATLRPVDAVARPVPIVDASATMAYEATSLPQRRKRRASAPLAVGERYELGAPIGRGGMGEVLSAYDAQIGREVAIKRLQPDRTTPGALARFLREARIQGRLDHPAIPPVYELAEDDHGNPFFAMKKLSGVTLSEILHSPEVRERFPLQRLLRAFVEICLAIEFAHSRGIIHRDLKPSNMLLGEFGEVYVLDWGVARVLDETDPREADGPHFGEVTVAGTTLGTPGYMSPEQVRGERDLDARADVYALGCVLYEIVSGRRLHPPGLAGMKSALVDRPARPSTYRDDIAPELDELCRLATT
jgi:serine/threonine-protein kinase